MTEKVREQLSAFADDELGASEARLLVARAARDPALRKTLEHYHLTGECLRGALARFHAPDLADRVMAALANETVGFNRRRVPRWLKTASGLAVAASVAIIAILGVQQQANSPLPSEIVPLTAEQNAPVINYANFQPASWGQTRPEVRSQLNRYLLQHNEHAVHRPVQGMLPYLHIVVYDARAIEEAARRAEEADARPEEPEARKKGRP